MSIDLKESRERRLRTVQDRGDTTITQRPREGDLESRNPVMSHIQRVRTRSREINDHLILRSQGLRRSWMTDTSFRPAEGFGEPGRVPEPVVAVVGAACRGRAHGRGDLLSGRSPGGARRKPGSAPW